MALRTVDDNTQLADRLKKKGIEVKPQTPNLPKYKVNDLLVRNERGAYVVTAPPNEMFWGGQVPGGLFDVSYNANYESVYTRFVTPDLAVINGNRKGVKVTSLEIFDDALGNAFRSPHRFTLRTGHNVQTVCQVPHSSDSLSQ